MERKNLPYHAEIWSFQGGKTAAERTSQLENTPNSPGGIVQEEKHLQEPQLC